MNYKIPLFDLNFGDEEKFAIIKTLESKWISMGENVSLAERKFSSMLSVTEAVAVSSCTAALHLALKVLNIQNGDEVIVPSLTFVATVNAVKYVSATPVFADITSLNNFSINPQDIEKKITKRTKAIIVMHYGGFSCDMDEIMKLSKRYNLYVIEDSAHAPLAEYKGRKLGTIGDIGCFSFFSNKNITCAEGGMIISNNSELTKKAKLLRAHGMTSLSYDRAKGHSTEYDVLELGYNYRLDDIRGSLLLTQLDKLNEDIIKRQELRELYIKGLNKLDGIIIPYKDSPYTSSNYIFPILLKNGNISKRNEFRQKLVNLGIQTSIHYPAVHKFSIYDNSKITLPKTEYVSDNEITLPLFPKLTEQQINEVISAIKQII